MIPAPMPISVLVTISSVSERDSMHPMPLIRNIEHPAVSILILLRFTDQCPASSINGMISNEGNDSSISTSSSWACGNIVSIRSSIGEMANPGSDTIAEIDQIATTATNGIDPFPVSIFIVICVCLGM